ncbi:MAG TPA: histidine kinase [Sphingomicrobium sp.]|jgi:sensor histidine kinase YesM|nr:histidine kinase [Sphingomicrobium sp.]
MISLPVRRPAIARQAAKLTLGLWAFTFVLFLLPSLVAEGRIPNFVVGSIVLDIIVGIALSVLLYIAAARVAEASLARKVVTMAIAVCIAAFLFSLFDSWLGGEIIRIFMGAHRIPKDIVNMTVSNFISFSWLYGMLGSIYVILQANAVMREREVQLLEARAVAQTAQLTALRLQLNPHFLFNTLNAISSLIVTGRSRQGEAMLSKLCEFLRTALSADGSGKTSLGDELEVLQTYLDIEAIRFGDRLTVEYDCPLDLIEVQVPNFILQPLVENAIKHAVAPTSRPVVIRVGARREGDEVVISISDNGGGIGSKAGTGVGLANTRQRLEVVYDGKARLETIAHDSGFVALIRLPAASDPSLTLVA